MNLHKKHLLAFFALAAASTIWGVNSPIMKITLQTVPVFTLAFIRFGIASLILFPFVFKKLHITKQDLPKVIFAGICAVTLNIGFFFWGIKLTTALNAGIIVSCTPIFSLFFAKFFLKETIAPKLVLGAIFGAIGIGFLIGRDLFAHGFSFFPAGDLLILCATLSFVGYETISKKLTTTYSSFALTYCFFLVGALTFLPLAFFENTHNPHWIQGINTITILGILYGIFFSSLGAYSLWEWGLSQVTESRVGFFFYLDPITATIAAVLLLGEKITLPFVIGALFIFAGIFIAEGHLPYHHLHRHK